MHKITNKFIRNNMEDQLIRYFRRVSPNYDSYLFKIRKPTLSSIVVYSKNPNPSTFLDKILPQYKYIKPSAGANDFQMSKKVAEQVLLSSQTYMNGVFIQGFPFNVNQALHLDHFLGGVNLALYIASDQNYKNQISGMLNYYNEKGVLLEIKDYGNPSLEQIEKIRWDIQANLKISE